MVNVNGSFVLHLYCSMFVSKLVYYILISVLNSLLIILLPQKLTTSLLSICTSSMKNVWQWLLHLVIFLWIKKSVKSEPQTNLLNQGCSQYISTDVSASQAIETWLLMSLEDNYRTTHTLPLHSSQEFMLWLSAGTTSQVLIV